MTAAAKRASRRKTAAPKRTSTRRRPPSRIRRFLSGDRPYVLALFAVAAALCGMLLNPLQSFTSTSERVDELRASRDDLTAVVDKQERRRSELFDPSRVELLAREQLGLVKPGEIPYVVADSKRDVERLPVLTATTQPERKSLWRRIVTAFGKLFERASG